MCDTVQTAQPRRLHTQSSRNAPASVSRKLHYEGAIINKSHSPVKNQLLAALPEAELERWLPHLERVNLALGQVL